MQSKAASLPKTFSLIIRLIRLKKYARELFAKAGKIISVKEVKPENQLRGSFIIEGEKTNIEIYFTLSPENPPLIQEYRIRGISKENVEFCNSKASGPCLKKTY